MLRSEALMLRSALSDPFEEFEQRLLAHAFSSTHGATYPAAILSDLAPWRRAGDRAAWTLLRLLASPHWRAGWLRSLRSGADERRAVLRGQQREVRSQAERVLATATIGTAERLISALGELAAGWIPPMSGDEQPRGHVPIPPAWTPRPQLSPVRIERSDLTLALMLAQTRRARHARAESMLLDDLERVTPTFMRQCAQRGDILVGRDPLLALVDRWWGIRHALERRFRRPVELLAADLAALLEGQRLPALPGAHDQVLLRAQAGLL